MSSFVPLFSEPASQNSTQPERFAALAVQPDAPSAGASASIRTDRSRSGQPDAAPGASTHDGCSEPRVTLIRDQDQVSRIVIECPCGRKMEFDCVY